MDEWDESLPPLSRMFLQVVLTLYSSHYLNECIVMPKSGQLLWILLNVYKEKHKVIFKSHLHIWPQTFDSLLDKICDDPMFHNNSENNQLPVDLQLAITLFFRFGHYGNVVSIQKVGLWDGVGGGTVDLCMWRVMMALCSECFHHITMAWPNEAIKEWAKEWVEAHSCYEWRDGWCMVDGTLVPLFCRPGFFRNTWFDQKSNYSLNVQVHLLLLSK